MKCCIHPQSQIREHWRGAAVNDRAGETTIATAKALVMLSAFADVGTRSFTLTLTDIDGGKMPGGYQPNRSLAEMQRTVGLILPSAAKALLNVIIRPRSATALLVQLDDLDAEKVVQIVPHAFMTVCTSPGNYQLWLAVSDGPKESDKEAAKLLRTRVRRGAGADQSAIGATRIAGSLNFKHQYAPEYPMVVVDQVSPGRMTTVAALEQAGLIAAEPPSPPASAPPQIAPRVARSGTRYWPDYQQALRGAPRKGDGTPDRSLADYMFCKWAAERGWSAEETAEKLAEVSAKAQERIRVKNDPGYALLTARNAAGPSSGTATAV
jgi:hypothetical protein